MAEIAVGFAVADAYGAQKRIDFERGGAPSAFDRGTRTEDPFVGSLFGRVIGRPLPRLHGKPLVETTARDPPKRRTRAARPA